MIAKSLHHSQKRTYTRLVLISCHCNTEVEKPTLALSNRTEEKNMDSSLGFTYTI